MTTDIYDNNVNATVLDIYVGSTWFKVKSDASGNLVNGFNVTRFVRSNLCEHEFDVKRNHWVVMRNYSSYDPITGMAIFPRYSLDKFLEAIEDTPINIIEVPPVEARDIKCSMKKNFQPRNNQQACIDFICDPKRKFAPLSAACGDGKTFISIYSITQIGKCAIIVLGLLIDQWYKCIRDYTNIKKDDIYVIKGFQSLKDLIEMLKGGFKPKIIIFSTRTLMFYAVDRRDPYDKLDLTYEELLVKAGVGILIHDEVHLQFHANTKIDMCTNVEKNIFLSATYMRSDTYGERIFNNVFPREQRFGEQFARKFSTVYVKAYHLGIQLEDTYKFNVPKGYLHALYESWLLKHKVYFLDYIDLAITNNIQMYYLNVATPGQKCLILCQTVKFVEAMLDKIVKAYPDKKVGCYFSGHSKYGKASQLENDIIVSTVKSCSTGIDLKNLKTCINTVSFASAPQAAQCLGRLRYIEGVETIFVDLWNNDVPRHKAHVQERMNAYRKRAAKLIEIN